MIGDILGTISDDNLMIHPSLKYAVKMATEPKDETTYDIKFEFYNLNEDFTLGDLIGESRYWSNDIPEGGIPETTGYWRKESRFSSNGKYFFSNESSFMGVEVDLIELGFDFKIIRDGYNFMSIEKGEAEEKETFDVLNILGEIRHNNLKYYARLQANLIGDGNYELDLVFIEILNESPFEYREVEKIECILGYTYRLGKAPFVSAYWLPFGEGFVCKGKLYDTSAWSVALEVDKDKLTLEYLESIIK